MPAGWNGAGPRQCDFEDRFLEAVLEDPPNTSRLGSANPRYGKSPTASTKHIQGKVSSNLVTIAQPIPFLNNIELAQMLNKLIKICSGTALGKEILADLTLQDLIVNITQTQHLAATDDSSYLHEDNLLAFMVNSIKANINEKIQVEDLSENACMGWASLPRIQTRV